MDGKKRRIQQVFVVVTVVGLLFVVGCATSKSTAQLSGEKIFLADKAFSDAKDGNASLNATDALAVAEGKLARAKDAFAKQNFEEAATGDEEEKQAERKEDPCSAFYPMPSRMIHIPIPP